MDNLTIFGIAIGVLIISFAVLSAVIAGATNQKKRSQENEQIIALLKKIADK